MTGERREYDRRPMKGRARVTMEGRPPMMVSIIDISLGGLSVVSHLNLPNKLAIKVEFNILLRKTGDFAGMRTAAVVAYSAFSHEERGFKLGLQFTGLSDHSKAAIQQYVGVKEKPKDKPEDKPKEKPDDNPDDKSGDKLEDNKPAE
jgi:c-di-GMP-binding flagellar brake protein YcgR